MFSVRLQIFRSFEDAQRLDIRPITVSLGRNGSGKSSITRFFPMLRQTFERRCAAPVLLLGDYVDFGQFDDIRSKSDPDAPIQVQINADASYFASTRARALPPYQRYPRLLTHQTFENLSYQANIINRGGRTQLDSFSLCLDSDSAYVELGSTGRVTKFTFNENDFTHLLSSDNVFVSRADLIPRITPLAPAENAINPSTASNLLASDERNNKLYEFYKIWLHGRTSSKTINRICRQTRYLSGERFLEQLRQFNPDLAYWSDVLATLKASSSNRERLRASYFLRDVPYYLRTLEVALYDTFRRCLYVGPSRATGERYYRLQELSVDFIDPEGTNFAMFLSSLGDNERKEFSKWTSRLFGFRVETKQQTGHVSVLVGESKSGRLHNLADVGYGYSQLLPVVAQMWLQKPEDGNRRERFSLLCFEQPELHLHPAMQCRIADALVDTIRLAGSKRLSGSHFIVETHSEALVNRLGDLVASGAVRASDIALYVFEKDIDAPTHIRRANFDDEGALENWPFGFFSWS
jgi:predicted ATPase